MTDLGRVGPEAALGGKPFSADVAVEGSVLGPLNLRIVIAQVLLQIGQLDEGPSAIREVALIGPLTCETKRQTIRKFSKFVKSWEVDTQQFVKLKLLSSIEKWNILL